MIKELFKYLHTVSSVHLNCAVTAHGRQQHTSSALLLSGNSQLQHKATSVRLNILQHGKGKKMCQCLDL